PVVSFLPRPRINVLGFGGGDGPVLVVASSPAGLRCTVLYAMLQSIPLRFWHCLASQLERLRLRGGLWCPSGSRRLRTVLPLLRGAGPDVALAGAGGGRCASSAAALASAGLSAAPRAAPASAAPLSAPSSSRPAARPARHGLSARAAAGTPGPCTPAAPASRNARSWESASPGSPAA